MQSQDREIKKNPESRTQSEIVTSNNRQHAQSNSRYQTTQVKPADNTIRSKVQPSTGSNSLVDIQSILAKIQPDPEGKIDLQNFPSDVQDMILEHLMQSSNDMQDQDSRLNKTDKLHGNDIFSPSTKMDPLPLKNSNNHSKVGSINKFVKKIDPDTSLPKIQNFVSKNESQLNNSNDMSTSQFRNNANMSDNILN